MLTSIEDAIGLIHAANRVAVATHTAPDGDAIGSLLAMGRILDALDKKFMLLCADRVPVRLHFLPHRRSIRHALDSFTPDLLVSLDADSPSRLGTIAQPLIEAGLPIINLDHHVTNENFGTVNLVDPSLVSTSEGVLALLDALEIRLNKRIAICLLTGLVTDTRGFRTANVTPKSLTIASRLIEAGADLPQIVESTLDRRSVPELRLIGQGLKDFQLEEHTIWTVLPFDKDRADAGPTGLSSMLLGAKNARVSAVFREKAEGQVEMSFRAARGYDVARVAVTLGGGGHKLAAGAMLEGPLEEVVARVVPLLKQAADNGTGES
jgi:phosphoesterase RecJ-like protein